MPRVVVDGLNTHYEEYGVGTPVVLIHGAQGTVEGFDAMVLALRSKYRVVTPSLPGRGGSENLRGEVSIERYSNHVAHLLSKIGVRKAVVGGSSMGGLVSLSFCLNHPDKTLALVLISTSIKLPVDERVVELFDEDYEGMTRLAASLGYSKKTEKDVIEMALKYNIECPKETSLKDMRATGKFNPSGRLSDVRVPTLVIVGSDDILTPRSMSEMLKKDITGSTVEVIKDAGHSCIIEKPREISEVIMRFLRKHGI